MPLEIDDSEILLLYIILRVTPFTSTCCAFRGTFSGERHTPRMQSAKCARVGVWCLMFVKSFVAKNAGTWLGQPA
jgi:hypothetical protein